MFYSVYILQVNGEYSSYEISYSVEVYEIKSSVNYTQTADWLITTDGFDSCLHGAARG